MPDRTVSNYSGFDFRALWKGRRTVTEVERALVDRELRAAEPTRVLEVGTGFGRLSATVSGLAEELVVSDYDRAAIERLEWPPGVRPPALRVALNLYHLPFRDGSFGAATLVRVHHHLGDPRAALRELARVLRPRGRLLISYNPRPSIGTLVHDLRHRIVGSPSDGAPPVSWARGRTVHRGSGPFPVYVSDRREFRSDALAVGFRIEHELGSGFEEFALLRRWVPTRFFLAAAGPIGRAPGAPTRWALLVRSGEPDRGAGHLNPLWECLACPRCGQPLRWAVGDLSGSCGACGFRGERRGDLLDLRYRPDGVPVASAAGDAVAGTDVPDPVEEPRPARGDPSGRTGVVDDAPR